MRGKNGGEGWDMLPGATVTWHEHAKHLKLGMRPAVSHVNEPLMTQPKLREAPVGGARTRDLESHESSAGEYLAARFRSSPDPGG